MIIPGIGPVEIVAVYKGDHATIVQIDAGYCEVTWGWCRGVYHTNDPKDALRMFIRQTGGSPEELRAELLSLK